MADLTIMIQFNGYIVSKQVEMPILPIGTPITILPIKTCKIKGYEQTILGMRVDTYCYITGAEEIDIDSHTGKFEGPGEGTYRNVLEGFDWGVFPSGEDEES